MRVAITGASGLIGSALAESLAADGHEVLRMVRRPADEPDEVAWHPGEGWVETAKLEGADAVIHVAAASIRPTRWTPTYRRSIRDSRVVGTRTVAAALAGMDSPPPRLLCGSAVGYYGETGQAAVDEHASRGEGFLAELVAEWEAATQPAEQVGISVVHLRSGVVLSPFGGQLAAMLPVFRLGLGGRIGSGRQFMSWIALADEVDAIRFLLEHPEITGPVNLCAPEPVTNADFTRALGAALRRPTPFAAPGFALRAALGLFADEAALASQRVLPARLQEAGYTFRHPELHAALEKILRD